MKKNISLMPFRCEPLAGGMLVSNDFGGWLVLTDEEFRSLKVGSFNRNEKLLAKLSGRGFIRERLDFEGIARDLGGLYRHSFGGPSLHILVVTPKCNHT